MAEPRQRRVATSNSILKIRRDSEAYLLLNAVVVVVANVVIAVAAAEAVEIRAQIDKRTQNAAAAQTQSTRRPHTAQFQYQFQHHFQFQFQLQYQREFQLQFQFEPFRISYFNCGFTSSWHSKTVRACSKLLLPLFFLNIISKSVKWKNELKKICCYQGKFWFLNILFYWQKQVKKNLIFSIDFFLQLAKYVRARLEDLERIDF